MRAITMLMVLAALLGSNAVFAQVTAKTLETEKVAEMESPMQLEIPLGATERRRSIDKLGFKESWYTSETAQFVVDKASVTAVWLMKKKARKKQIELTASARVATEWYRQDINLTMALVVEGQEVRSKKWRKLTIGRDTGLSPLVGASSTKSPTAEWIVSKQELDEWFAGAPPTLRITVEIVDD